MLQMWEPLLEPLTVGVWEWAKHFAACAHLQAVIWDCNAIVHAEPYKDEGVNILSYYTRGPTVYRIPACARCGQDLFSAILVIFPFFSF